jgi:hypothetical protein
MILQYELREVSELTQFSFRIGHDVSDLFPDLGNPSRKEGFFRFEEGLTSEISQLVQGAFTKSGEGPSSTAEITLS